MKKILALALALVMIFAIAACGGGGTTTDPGPADPGTTDPGPADPGTPAEPPPAAGADVKVALVAHGPESIQFDGSFNEGSWNGILGFLNNNGLNASTNASFFQSHAADDVARVDVMSDAISWGADVLILPGFHFAMSVGEAQDLFPDTIFVILDARPFFGGPEAANTVSILYAEEQSGFLAGYATVMEGHRNLGFMGGVAVPAVVRFGHGFIEGAEYASKELGLAAGDVTINYHYIGAFAPDPGVTTMAGAWYAGGTEVIFAAAGGAGFSVIAAAEDAGTWMIGVDVDQAGDSPRVLTSAMKALAVSVDDMLNDFVNGSFRGGRDLLYDASTNGIGLPMENSRFSNFSMAQYDAIFAQLANRTVHVSTTLPEEGGTTNPNDLLYFTDVTVNFIN